MTDVALNFPMPVALHLLMYLTLTTIGKLGIIVPIYTRKLRHSLIYVSSHNSKWHC